MYVCLYVYICMYVCTYVYIYVCMFVRMYIYMYVSLYVCIYICMYLCTYVYTYVCMYVCIGFVVSTSSMYNNSLHNTKYIKAIKGQNTDFGPRQSSDMFLRLILCNFFTLNITIFLSEDCSISYR